MTIPYHVFVYGTLKPGERYYEQFCAPYVIEKQDAIAPGRLYDLSVGYPGMTIEEGQVLGVRLTFTDEVVLARLDALEEFFPDRPEDSEYQRLERPLLTPKHEPLGLAWAYIMTPERVKSLQGLWLPSGHWSRRNLSVEPNQMHKDMS
ncbi:MAG TPA: gamma-glutamylcyclotransferase family protein [Leptolyngbyaceae cyanobacterium]